MADTYVSLVYRKACKLAEAIYEYLNYYGVSEIEAVENVLSGEQSVEDFIREVETDLAQRKSS